jgi:hypothetical protein
MTTRLPSPPGVSAITFSVRPRRVSASTITSTGVPVPASPSPRSETSTTGISIPGMASVPLGTPRRLSTVSNTTTARAPARSALRAFSRKKQTPRCTSGISPDRRLAKSSDEQPFAAERSVPRARPDPE